MVRLCVQLSGFECKIMRVYAYSMVCLRVNGAGLNGRVYAYNVVGLWGEKRLTGNFEKWKKKKRLTATRFLRKRPLHPPYWSKHQKITHTYNLDVFEPEKSKNKYFRCVWWTLELF